MRKLLLLFGFLMAGVVMASVTDVAVTLDRLVSRGNRAYELSQRSVIRTCTDSLAFMIEETALQGDALLDYTVALEKLLGNYYYECEQFDSAAWHYLRAKELIDTNPDTDFHGNALLMLRELAQLYYRLGKYDKAVEALAEADDILEYTQSYLPGSDPWLTTKMTYAISLARTGQTREAIEMGRAELANALDKKGEAYARAQRMYAKILLLANVDRQGALKAYKKYFDTQKKFALGHFSAMTARQRSEYWQALRPFITDCYLLEDADPEFLYDVALFSKGLLLHLERQSGAGTADKEAVKSLGYTVKDIKKRLKPGEAAIEFIEYEKDGERRMAALVARPKAAVMFIPLAPTSEVSTLGGRAMSSIAGNGKTRLYRNRKLHAMVWPEELLAALDGVESIYFSPDGYLHRLGIEYMLPVADRKLYRLSSTRRLMEPSPRIDASSAMLLIGNVDYDTPSGAASAEGNDTVAYSRYAGKWFPALEDSTDEATAIYGSRGVPADTLLSSSAATEEAFRRAAPGFAMILVSTHGDFSNENAVATDVKGVYGDDEMSENIFALAGVNVSLTDGAGDYSQRYDGLLSAAEIAGLDLSRCRLFIVSACQSGLGEITSDGVFGLQRGLKRAGVEAMVVSLWSVNSEATGLLMIKFYEGLMSGASLPDSFSAARSWLITDSSYPDPQYTDAFLLIDALP